MKTSEKVAEVVGTCERYSKSSIIALSGPPGSGKSHVALLAAQAIAKLSTRVREIQFHQSYSYEEFIEGLRIAPDGSVRPEKGVFLRVNEDAEADKVPGHKYVLLIEEFTRANLSSVLGELLTYVEHRSRAFETMFSRTSVQVSSNLVLIVTFNPTDRSAVNIDDALLRRMRIIDFFPDADQLEEMLTGRALSSHVLRKLGDIFRTCESEHQDLYASRMPFGHGIFSEAQDESDLHSLWHQRIQRILYRPGQDPHEFAETIERSYPWAKSTKFALPIPMGSIVTSTDKEVQPLSEASAENAEQDK